MKQKIITLWMVIFAAATFFISPVILIVLANTQILSNTWIDHVMQAWRVTIILSLLAALFLGLGGALPGTKPLVGTTSNTNATLTILTRIAIILTALFTYFMWVAFQPPAGRPNVSITFLGYTNDTTGTKLARIAVTNLNTSAVFAYAPLVETPSLTTSADSTYYHSGGDSRWHAMLGSGASDTFTILTPTNESPWRLQLYVYPDRGAVRVFIKDVVGICCMSIGIMPRFMRMPYEIKGDWIKSESENYPPGPAAPLTSANQIENPARPSQLVRVKSSRLSP
jgi:hypothetical protein